MAGAPSDHLLRGYAWARLGAATLLLALGPSIPADLMPITNRPVVACALVVVAVSSAWLLLVPVSRRARLARWAASIVDAVVVTAVVAATGGGRSMFSFLYVLLVVAACLLLSRTGGVAVGGLCSALYIGVVFTRTVVPMTLVLDAPEETTALELMTMFLNSGTLLVIAIVAGGLAERFHAARAELEAKRRALDDLQIFKDLVFQSVETGLVAIDRRHRITAFNRAAAEITGVSAADAMGRTWSSLFGDAVPVGAVEATLDAQPRAISRHELALPRPDGTTAPLRIAFSALRSADGGRLGLIAACEDLTTLRALESRMRQADRLATLGRMAANIAHEIRNPLASMTGAIEVLVGAERPPEMRERLASIVLRESGRLNEIIKGFLEYARPAPLVPAATEVAECLDEILVLIEHRAAPGSLKIVREFSSPLIVTVDPQQFRQAIWNLCLNAVQAMPEGGELRVGASVHDGRLEVRVTDTGEGITTEDLPHVFEPFFSTKDQGTGLGLALVHRIVQDHGGDVEVQSVPGAGTTFVVSLPVPHA